MIDKGKFPILGVNIHAVDYEAATNKIIESARNNKGFGVTALAVHGVMTGFYDEVHRKRLNGLDMITPDGQPVRWALKWKHAISLPDRVSGPDLTLHVLRKMSENGLSVYFYGSTNVILGKLKQNLRSMFPDLNIVGIEPSKFRKINDEEKENVIERIKESGADVVFVGLGCPRQEVWTFEYKDLLEKPVIAVGAAFAFHAGTLSKAPGWMEDSGLEWLYRLSKEPRRLWKRYLYLNPAYLYNLFKEIFKISEVEAVKPTGDEPTISYG